VATSPVGVATAAAGVAMVVMAGVATAAAGTTTVVGVVGATTVAGAVGATELVGEAGAVVKRCRITAVGDGLRLIQGW
jgi:hypothetical protein